MPISFTNRKGVTYYLCAGVTNSGKPRYYMARVAQDPPVEVMPPGYEITENVHGQVSAGKPRQTRILPGELRIVEAALYRHPDRRRYRLSYQRNWIELYESSGANPEEIVEALGLRLGMERTHALARMESDMDRWTEFAPIVRFKLHDPRERVFRVERRCYLGSMPDWVPVLEEGPLDELVSEVIPLLGTEDFFDVLAPYGV